MINLILVEDDPMVMSVNESFILRVGGFQIVNSARTGRLALELIEKHKPRLVILDVYLPDMSGIQILKELRRQGTPTDVIMITAADEVNIVQDAIRFGVVDYIIKPFKFERIKAALEKYKAYSNKFRDQRIIDQEQLDNLTRMNSFPVLNNPDSDVLPKGLREITLKQVITFLGNGKQGYSAEEVAEGVGLARVTARRYLEYLGKNGRVCLESQYGSVGRPVNIYKVNR
ncbi:response regulator [Desulfosporosinus metallidurans]|uniref:Transcriptional regulatory protein n=1 Tax=Desulfosporosinus metallidurans TaxID=1888891 RepID=A0A1Q8QNX1_9FIRM|nr:Transcriptional regulatory protein dcuR [Desulfosporosinus metallidurans]